MTIMYRIFVALGGLLALFLCAALIAPYFINWDDYSGEFEKQASEILGVPVKVGGDAQVRLLPLPSVSYSQLEVGQDLNGNPLMQADSFSLKVELFPFLTGDVQIVEMFVDRPYLNLVMGDDGLIAWGESSNSAFTPEHVEIEKLKIRQGKINISGLGGGRSVEATNINGEVSAKSLLGPWKMDLTSDVNDVRSAFKISTGQYQPSGNMRLKVDAKREDRPYRLLMDGPLNLGYGQTSWDGKFTLDAFSEEQVDEMTIRHEPLPIALEGSFSANPKLIALNDYRLEVGKGDVPYYVTGSAQMEMLAEPFFKVQADGAQIDLQNLDREEATEGEEEALNDGFAGLIDALTKVPVPSSKGVVYIHLPALVSKDSFVREIKASISPHQNGWLINKSSAQLPGNTAFEAGGMLQLKDELKFDGDILLASRQPTGFAAWVSGEVDPVFRKLSSFGLGSKISASPAGLKLDDMELRLDDALIQGSFERKLNEDLKPELHLALDGNEMDAGRLKALYALIIGSREDIAQVYDLDVDLKADAFLANIADRNLDMKGLDAHVQLREGAINLERLNVEEVLGAKITSSGNMDNLLGQPSGNTKFELSAEDGTQLARFLQEMSDGQLRLERFINQPELSSKTNLNVELDTKNSESGTKGQVLAKGEIGGTQLNLQIGFDGLVEGLKFQDIPLTLSAQSQSNSPSVLLRQLGFEMMPVEVFGEMEGPMKLSLDMQGKGSGDFKTRVSSSLPDSNLLMEGVLENLGSAETSSRFQLKLGSENFDAYAKNFGVQLPGIGFSDNVPLSLSATLSTSQEGFKFEQLNGQVSGNTFVGDLAFLKSNGGRTKIDGTLELNEINPAFFMESVYGVGQDVLISSDNNTFKTPYFEGVDGNLSLSASQLIIDEEVIGINPKFNIELDDGNLIAKAPEIEVFGGHLTGEMELRNIDGLVLANASYQLQDAGLSKLIDAAQLPAIWQGRAFVSGSLETSGSSAEEITKNLAGAGIIKFSRMQVEGYNPEGFKHIVSKTEEDDFEPGADIVRDMIAQNLLVDSMDIPQVESNFIISRGHLKVNKMAADIADSKVVGAVDVDLHSGEFKAELDTSFDQAKNHVVEGAQPQLMIKWQGNSEAFNRDIDGTRLEGYLTLKVFELKQKKIEAEKARALEIKRKREEEARILAEKERLERLKREEEERLRAIAEAEAARISEQPPEETSIEVLIQGNNNTASVEPSNELREALKDRLGEGIDDIGIGSGRLEEVNRLQLDDINRFSIDPELQ